MPVKYIDDISYLYESKIGNQDQLVQNTSDLKHTGPEAADGFQHPEIDPKNKKRKDSDVDEKKFSDKVDESDEKQVKKEQLNINNSTMSNNPNKSSFDKLFEDVMGDDLPMEMDMPGLDMGGDDLNDELGGDDDDNGDTVTLTLDRDIAEKLHGMLEDLLGGGDDDLNGDEGVEDIEDIDEEGLELNPEAATELEHGPSDVVSKLAGKNNKVGDSNVHPSGGSADGSAGGEEDGGKPKAHGHQHGDNKPGDNKVANRSTVGGVAYK